MPDRERYNAKARASTAGSARKKGKRRCTFSSQIPSQPEDSNVLLLIPKTQEDKENARKEKIRRDVRGKCMRMSSKKKRRLEKYIDKKLRKEERVILFEKLAQSQASSASAKLQPSSALGSGRPFTHEQKLSRSEDQETRRALQRLGASTDETQKRKRNRPPDSEPATENDNSHSEMADVDVTKNSISNGATRKGSPAREVLDQLIQGQSVQSSVGSALRRNPDGTIMGHMAVKRKSKAGKGVFQKWKDAAKRRDDPALYDDDSSDSFDSSDSAYDTSPEPSFAGSDVDAEEEWTGFADHARDLISEGAGPQDNPSTTNTESEDAEDSDGHERQSRARKAAGFKDWALRQLAVSKGYEHSQPMASQPDSAPLGTSSVPQLSETSPKFNDPIKGPLGELVPLPSTTFAKHVHDQNRMLLEPSHRAVAIQKNIPVERPERIQATRLLLPIIAEEQPIMEAILLNPVLVICGETGSGKTTQVPQFLYEAGFGSPGSDNPGMIGITQPRRVAAMSMASRVATELSLSSSRVSYQIRYDGTVSPTTSIKFMTDGVLLRELAADLLLSKYSVIVVDEAHERSMNTDIAIGVLSRVVRLREAMWEEEKGGVKPLRLIIMSATLRVADFTSNTTLFSSPPPVINISSRQHPVTIHFSRVTAPDYVTEALRKTVKIHSRLPPGGILVFLTGQNEIKGVCKKLEARFGRKAVKVKKRRRQNPEGHFSSKANGGWEQSAVEWLRAVPSQVDIEAEDMDMGADMDEALPTDMDSVANEITYPDALDSDQDPFGEDPALNDDSDIPMHIVPLYSLLSSNRQMDVFQPPPSGARLVVVSTNIAETSITIPGIRYVVDCGRAKERKYDIQSGIQSFQVSWISKASAAQRAGRAGRTGPGHCYRLYSSALFEHHFDEFAQPEILRVPIEGIVLQMKSMNIDTVVNFPFPTPPDRASLKRAETVLHHLGSLNGTSNESPITNLGRTMALFPVSPRFSKMLVVGKRHGCLPYVIAIVSALSVGDPFLHEEALNGGVEDLTEEAAEENGSLNFSHIRSTVLKEKEEAKARRRAYFASQQTHGSLGRGSSDVFRMLSVVGAYEYAGGGRDFCTEQFVRPKAMEEIHKLRYQITQIVQTNFPDVAASFIGKLQPPNDEQLKVLRQVLTAGFVDQVAVRKDIVDKSTASGNKYSSARGVPYRALSVSDDVFIHPSSILYHTTPPDYVIYHEIVRTSHPWMKILSVINPAWLPKLGPTLCTLSKPLKSSGSDVIVFPRYGPALWELPPIKCHA